MSDSLLSVVLCSLFLMLGGCSSSKLQVDINQNEIPSEAETAVVISGLPADSLFSVVTDSLIHQGYILNQKNRQIGAITTRSSNIGQNIQMRMSFLIKPIDSESSRMTVRSEWRTIPTPKEKKAAENMEELEASGWKAAIWKDPKSSRRAFAYMVKFIHRLPYTRIKFN